MPELVKSDDVLASEYALGLLRGEARAELAARLAADNAFSAKVEHWRGIFSGLENDDERGAGDTPSAGVFEAVLNHIDTEGRQLPGTKTRRRATAQWTEIAPGVRSRVLHVDRANNRLSVLVRMDPGSSYQSHEHDIEEETLVLEGDLFFGDLKLSPGDYHVASTESHHPVATTLEGCLVHVVTSIPG